jgi:hypothetical protein
MGVHVLDLVIWDWRILKNVRSHQQTVPKFWAKNQFDWPIAPKKMKLWRLLKIEGSVLMYIVPPLGPTYIGESAKTYGLKVRCLCMENMLSNTL